jgi:hypothetical protein
MNLIVGAFLRSLVSHLYSWPIPDNSPPQRFRVNYAQNYSERPTLFLDQFNQSFFVLWRFVTLLDDDAFGRRHADA